MKRSTVPTAGDAAPSLSAERVDAVVVGAGIAGLACAERLHRRGADVRVLEAAERVGGKIGSIRVPQGYLLELGPHEVRSDDPELFRQFRTLDIEGERVPASPAVERRYVVSDGRPVPLPGSPLEALSTDLLSTRGKLRLLSEPFVARGTGDDESVMEFFSRRLGPEVAHGPIDAFVSGVYAADPASVSMRAAFPSLLEGERAHGSLLRWVLHRWRHRDLDGDGSRAAELFSFRGGLRTWPEALADALGRDRLWTSAPVRAVRPVHDGWSVRWGNARHGGEMRARHVILALPADGAADLLGDLEPGLSRALAGIDYAPVAVVHLGFPRARVEHPLDGFGVLAPGAERRSVLGILWVSSLFDGRSPDDVTLTASFLGGSRSPRLLEASDRELVGHAAAEHRSLLGASGPPVFNHVHRWQRALPRYGPAHSTLVRRLARAERRRPGLHVTGNYRAGIGLPDTWRDGRRAAARVLSARPARA